MSLASVLPAPKQQQFLEEEQDVFDTEAVKKQVGRNIPPYPNRRGWKPSDLADYGDGGAYPEIHMAQFPLNMGKKSGKTNALTLQMDSTGKVKKDSLVTGGKQLRDNQTIFSDHQDLVPYYEKGSLLNMARPSEDEVEESTRRTQEALEKLVSSKIAASHLKSATKVGTQTKAPQMIKYSPADEIASNPGAHNRVIRMMEMPTDPMEPPKFKHKKLPRVSEEAPVPVMHSPPRKLTAQDAADWKIPPCVSNWKNNAGYVIPLDKRMAADGRGLVEVTINDNFAKLSESLYEAERVAREAVEKRAQMQKRIALKEKEKKEQELRNLAAKARAERAGYSGPISNEEEEEEKQRNAIREERRKDRERERRQSHMGAEKRAKLAARDTERDVSEKVALGLQVKPSQDSLFDQRLFNQDSGMSSGFGDDESYNIYDKKLFHGTSSIYRPRTATEDNYGSQADLDKLMSTDRFKPDKGFEGSHKAARRGAEPVSFEKEEAEADPFGLEQFMDDARSSKRTFANVGQSGGMSAAAGSNPSDLAERPSGRQRVDFERSRSTR